MATTSPNRRRAVHIRISCRQAELPPVQDVLVLGRRSPVGSNGVVAAMQALSPGQFRLLRVEHPVVEAMLVRETDLRKLPEEILIQQVLDAVGPMMDETDALNVELEVRVDVETHLELD